MANTEERISRLEEKTNDLTTNVSVLVQELHDFKDELKDFKDEMRGRGNQRATEIAELRGTFQTIQNTLLQMQASGRNQTIVTFLGIATMVIAVLLK